MKFLSKTIDTFDGISLQLQINNNEHEQWLILTHGIGEHLERHQYIHELLGDRYNICLYDLRGHGHSEGDRGAVSDFSYFRRDLQSVLLFLKSSFSFKEYSLFGHSLGGLIVSDFIQKKLFKKISLSPQAVFLSSPAIGIAGPLGTVFDYLPMKIHKVINNIPIEFRMQGLDDYSHLSHDPECADKYKKDSLVIKKLSSSLLLALAKTVKKVSRKNLDSPCPVYCSIGSKDKIVDFNKVCHYFENQDNTYLNKVEGGFHELHNEIDLYQKKHFDFIRESLI